MTTLAVILVREFRRPFLTSMVRYQLIRHIFIEGDVSDVDRQKLLEIANKCPIHRLLSGDIRIQSALA
jgi:uncharacterized OsmC-like protein